MVDFSPVPALAGGALIGLSASLMLLLNGRITGVSGIFGGLLRPEKGETLWRLAFVVGLLLAGLGFVLWRPGAIETDFPRSLAVVGAGGFLVGLGTRLANGCTSGHGICGLSRFSKRSLAATLTFMGTGAVTVFVVDHALRGVL
jgi:uncharacterized membrane protein YedE/YeeE